MCVATEPEEAISDTEKLMVELQRRNVALERRVADLQLVISGQRAPQYAERQGSGQRAPQYAERQGNEERAPLCTERLSSQQMVPQYTERQGSEQRAPQYTERLDSDTNESQEVSPQPCWFTIFVNIDYKINCGDGCHVSHHIIMIGLVTVVTYIPMELELALLLLIYVY